MTIQFNTDNNVTGSEELTAPLTDLISNKLDRFSDRITRVEVHLSDENGSKQREDQACNEAEAHAGAEGERAPHARDSRRCATAWKKRHCYEPRPPASRRDAEDGS